MLSSLNDVRLPDVLSLPKQEPSGSLWKLNWVPAGFEPHTIHRYKIAMTQKIVESQMYSDGLFNFSVYVSEKDDWSLKDQLVRQGRRTLQTVIKGDKEITIVGDIPPSTARQIVQSVTFIKSHPTVETDSTTQ